MKELLDYIKKHDLSKQEYFDYVASQIDLEEWTNYWITQSFFANTDTGNIRFPRLYGRYRIPGDIACSLHNS